MFVNLLGMSCHSPHLYCVYTFPEKNISGSSWFSNALCIVFIIAKTHLSVLLTTINSVGVKSCSNRTPSF